MTMFAGAIPLKEDGQVVGAIGVSGGSGEQDHGVAAPDGSSVLVFAKKNGEDNG
jgi:uncharacterized protein GlcG (DUF336 family)